MGKGFPTHGGSSHPRGEFTVHTHGVSRRVGKGFPHTTGGVHTHAGYQEGWEREFTPTGGVHPRGDTHAGYQEGWERDFPPTGGVHTRRVSRGVGKGVPTHGGSSHTRGIKKGGKGISHPRGESQHGGSSHTQGIKKGGKGSSHHTGGCHSRVTWYKSPVVQSKLPKLFFKLHLALPTGPGEGSVYSGWFVGVVGIFVLLSHGWHRCRCRLRGV